MDLPRGRYEHLIAGRWVPPAGGEYFSGTDPSTGQALGSFAKGNAADIDAAVKAARAGFEQWRDLEPAKRGRILLKVADLLRQNRDRLARLESMDMGKPLWLSGGDIETCARYFEYYGGAADKILGETIPAPGNHLVYTLREPYGVSAQITPWNSPIGQAARGAAPALAAGNAVVMKPAEQSSVTTFELALLCIEAGLPEGAFNVVTGFGEDAGQALVNHPGIDKITFTGSLHVGRLIMAAAARRVVPVTLELGGKSPFIVFADANLDMAAKRGAATVTYNTGQICSSGKRYLVERSAVDAFAEHLVRHLDKTTIGPALDDPQMGPIVSEEQLEHVLGYIDVGKKEGARLVYGGERLREGRLKDGFFVKPTVFVDVRNDMRIAQEEIFGPVATITPFDTEGEALAMANDSLFGLAAGVWTENVARAHRMARRLQAGQVYINNYQGVGIEAPFGGYKQSGLGREKGLEALRDYTQLKTVIVPTA